MTLNSPIAALAVTSVVAVSTVPAEADESFAQSVWPNVNFLDQSSRLAATRSKDKMVRSFARIEATEQTSIANALVAWTESRSSGKEVEQGAQEQPSRPGSLMAVPFRAASHLSSGVADAIDGVQTGRSVAIDQKPSGEHVVLQSIRLPNLEKDLKRLSGLSGKEFDKLYKDTQTDALLQLSTSYASYIQNGSDVALKALAIRALPGVNKRLAVLKTFE